MRCTPAWLVALVTLILTAPTMAQDNTVTMGVFVTVETENVPEFEDAARDHARWHADQNDPQAWPVYQALTGPLTEYAFLSPNMEWASMDNPALDMATDIEHWSESGARYATSEEASMWVDIPNSGNPPTDPTAYPVVQVFEFEIQSGKEAAVFRGIGRFKEAIDRAGADLRYGWSQVVSADQGPAVFLAIWFESFAELGAPGPTPVEILASAFGAAEAAGIVEYFSQAATNTASRIWTLRPDLSYAPN